MPRVKVFYLEREVVIFTLIIIGIHLKKKPNITTKFISHVSGEFSLISWFPYMVLNRDVEELHYIFMTIPGIHPGIFILKSLYVLWACSLSGY